MMDLIKSITCQCWRKANLSGESWGRPTGEVVAGRCLVWSKGAQLNGFRPGCHGMPRYTARV